MGGNKFLRILNDDDDGLLIVQTVDLALLQAILELDPLVELEAAREPHQKHVVLFRVLAGRTVDQRQTLPIMQPRVASFWKGKADLSLRSC